MTTSTAPYGVGQPADVDPSGGTILRDRFTGRTTGSRRIDPKTGDYAIDANGRCEGMPDVQQLVLLAVSTDLDSSSMRGLGHELKSIDRITANFERRVDSVIRAALQDLVTRKLVEVLEVLVTKLGNGRAYIKVRWRDLTTMHEHDQEVGR